jgi:hypothetical protein
VLNADGSAIKQVPFPADLQPCTATSCVVTANQQLEQKAFTHFMEPTAKPKAAKSPTTPKALTGHKKLGALNTSGLAADLPDGHSQVAQVAKARMPVYYPKFIKPSVNDASDTYCLAITGNCADGSEPATEYAHDQRTQAVPVRRRRPADDRRLASGRRHLLDLQHADQRHPQRTDGRDGGVDDPRTRLDQRQDAAQSDARLLLASGHGQGNAQSTRRGASGSERAAGLGWKRSSRASWRASSRVLSFVRPAVRRSIR